MTQSGPLPCLSRIEFFLHSGGELIAALAEAIRGHVERFPDVALSPAHAAVWTWANMSGDVPNGGFTQFFYNHRGDSGVRELASLLDSLDLPKVAALVRDATAVYRTHQAAFAVENPWDGLFGGIKEFDKLDRAFCRIIGRSERALEQWIRAHVAELAVDEAGEPIDPRFTGTVEIKQSNGLVGQYLEVKNGKPNGAYREFFEDGGVRKVVFYKSGKTTGDFWPNGQLKRKQSKRGPDTIIEWFYPSGRLQKRYVKGKNGYAAEPIQLFHENGQLAEQIGTASGKKRGPWLKFFDDGAPRLRAEYQAGEKLVVHDAWDENRNQVVKDGTGLFRNNGRGIDWPYDVFFETNWQTESELKGGVPHGKTTRFHGGVLWGVFHYTHGVQDGEAILFWDNGRVRTVTKYRRGKPGAEQSFPKFDRPVPAVVLSVEANEELYEAWQHMPVDEYPRVLNLDQVQRQLKPPAFLREVHERNLANSLQSDYEDWSTFKDTIAYFLTVNETGEVTSATANGSGVYSGGDWETYPPFLRQLRFTPARVRGRAVACRVLAEVDHTFVEGG